MSKNVLIHPAQTRQITTSTHDQVQIALAIADEPLLKSLLVNSTPPIAPPHRIGAISSTIGVPLASQKAVDGILSFESIYCVLADAPPEIDAKPVGSGAAGRNSQQREFARLTRCESELQTLGQSVPIAQAIALLNHAGFSTRHVEEILNLPYEAWHKSWWYAVDSLGHFTVPFLRLMRTLRYANGTLTLQYKDFFGQEKPICFKSQMQQVLIEIKTEPYSFHKTLQKINYSRAQLGIQKAILICDDAASSQHSVTDLEARGFISQNISLYLSSDLILPTQANCANCGTANCPLSGNDNSPVMMCHQFCLQAE
jgi:hypothetical protein